MKLPKISITGIGSISALGSSQPEIWQSYQNSVHFLQEKQYSSGNFFVGSISTENQMVIDKIREENPKYKSLDKSVLYAIWASRQALQQAGWETETQFGINIGSSRGATELFEKYHSDFLKSGQTSPLTSPTTTLGNIASWVAQYAKNQGIAISHSITCSTALHALVNGIAWLKADMTDKFLVGGSEAPLTDFTLSQLKALKIYANSQNKFPCQVLSSEKKQNTMVLGEGACVVCLEKNVTERTLAAVEGIGYATEPLTHNISISQNADCLQQTMRMALQNIDIEEVDIIIPHATGTIKGDQAELKAIELVFGKHKPFLTNNKWKIGHTFGASGTLSLEMALLMIKNQAFIKIPYLEYDAVPDKIRKILINAVGFGGNAVSVVISLAK